MTRDDNHIDMQDEKIVVFPAERIVSRPQPPEPVAETPATAAPEPATPELANEIELPPLDVRPSRRSYPRRLPKLKPANAAEVELFKYKAESKAAKRLEILKNLLVMTDTVPIELIFRAMGQIYTPDDWLVMAKSDKLTGQPQQATIWSYLIGNRWQMMKNGKPVIEGLEAALQSPNPNIVCGAIAGLGYAMKHGAIFQHMNVRAKPDKPAAIPLKKFEQQLKAITEARTEEAILLPARDCLQSIARQRAILDDLKKSLK